MTMGASGSRDPVPNIKGVAFVPSTAVESVPIIGIVDDKCRTLHEGPRTVVDALAP